jgi:hypothetical protein
LQFSLQAASPETFGYTLVYVLMAWCLFKKRAVLPEGFRLMLVFIRCMNALKREMSYEFIHTE